MYFNVNFNVFFKLIKVHLLVSKLYIRRSTLYVLVEMLQIKEHGTLNKFKTPNLNFDLISVCD